MLLKVKVFPGKNKEKIEEKDQGRLEIFLKEPAKNNRANNALILVLAAYFKTTPENIRIIKGRHSPNKTIEIKTDESLRY